MQTKKQNNHPRIRHYLTFDDDGLGGYNIYRRRVKIGRVVKHERNENDFVLDIDDTKFGMDTGITTVYTTREEAAEAACKLYTGFVFNLYHPDGHVGYVKRKRDSGDGEYTPIFNHDCMYLRPRTTVLIGERFHTASACAEAMKKAHGDAGRIRQFINCWGN